MKRKFHVGKPGGRFQKGAICLFIIIVQYCRKVTHRLMIVKCKDKKNFFLFFMQMFPTPSAPDGVPLPRVERC